MTRGLHFGLWPLLLAVTPLSCTCKSEPTRAELVKKLEGLDAGEERAMGDGVFMTMHRTQAEAPLGGGWHLATSTEGAFTVELPMPFNDFRMRTETDDKVELRTHVLGAKSAGLLAFSASCFVRKDGKLNAAGRGPGPQTTRPLGTPPTAWQRSVEFDDRSCVLIVEAQGKDPLPPEAERTRFLESLKRTGKPRW